MRGRRYIRWSDGALLRRGPPLNPPLRIVYPLPRRLAMDPNLLRVNYVLNNFNTVDWKGDMDAGESRTAIWLACEQATIWLTLFPEIESLPI